MKMYNLGSVSRSSIATLLLLSVVTYSTNAISDSMKECVRGQEKLFENIELDSALENLLTSYNETCQDDGLCTYKIDDETMAGLMTMGENDGAPAIDDIPGIKGSGEAYFGGKFYDHDSYNTYRTACGDAGGSMVCVDSHLTLDGVAGAAFMGGEGIATDVKINVKSFPLCMDRACENEDVTTILENTAKNALLNTNQVAQDLDSHTESLIQAATVKQICALSGLETCELVVEKKECSKAAFVKALDSPAAALSVRGGVVTFLALSLTVLFGIV
jgi:hypothetical protein